MTKLVYLECPTGIAGDMCLGALVHAGVPLEYLIEKLEHLDISAEYRLWAELVHRNGQQATKIHVDLRESDWIENGDPDSPQHVHSSDSASEHSHPQLHGHGDHDHATPSHPSTLSFLPHSAHPHEGRHLPEIEHLIAATNLPDRAKTWSLAVFRRLALAEGAVHGIAPDAVHFHEVGAVDAIVDIVGTCLGLDWLNIDQLYCSALPTGGGTTRAAHGILPVPTPAVLKLWEMRQVPIYSNGINRELVTPTGAAIATTLATQFGPPPPMTLHRVGLGAGSRNFEIPNILRLWVGEAGGQELGKAQIAKQEPPKPMEGSGVETIEVLQTQLDDLNPQVIGYVFEALLAAGALDVFTQAIGMKKSRPGILLTVICHPAEVEACEAVLFRETTTLGVRHSRQQRNILQREIRSIDIGHGIVRVKIAYQNSGKILNVHPEYEDCAKIARQTQKPLQEVQQLAMSQWQQNQAAKITDH
jgi:hypothetical protein